LQTPAKKGWRYAQRYPRFPDPVSSLRFADAVTGPRDIASSYVHAIMDVGG
jgi:hypothetical protein